MLGTRVLLGCLRAGVTGLMTALALVSCGGGTDGDAPTQTKPELLELSGVAYEGESSLGPSSRIVTLRGTQGLQRYTGYRRPYVFVVGLDDLAAPYALGLQLQEGRALVSIALRPGTVNVTPLTTLVVAELTGQDPVRFFAGAATSTLRPTDADIAAAERRARAYLRSSLGITVPDQVGNFVDASFSPTAGDPMFDLIQALNATLGARSTDIFAVAETVARRAAICNAGRISLTVANQTTDFCPRLKSAVPDTQDDSLVNFRFTGIDNAVIEVAARGDAVVSASFTDAQSRVSTCSGAGCAGLGLGTPAGDLSRPIVFANVVLTGAAGRVVLNGTLVSSVPGIGLPPLPCNANRYFIVYPDNTVAATCAAPDNTLAVGVGDVVNVGEGRLLYRFQTDNAVDPPPPPLEVRTEGQRVVSVFARRIDPATGDTTALYVCRDSDCNGVTIGPARDDVNSPPPYILRQRLITLDGTVLAAVNADGTPASGGPAIVSASLDSFEVVVPTILSTAPCASPSQRLTATLSVRPQPIEVCPPAPDPDLAPTYFLETSGNETDGLSFFINSLYVADVGGSALGGDAGGVRINYRGGAVVDATFQIKDTDAIFRCTGTACSGITISAPNGAGERTISMSNTLLREVETADLVGDRTVVLQGSFVAPAPPP